MPRLPIPYALRNLRRRPWHSLMCAAGVAVIVFASVLMLSLNRGLQQRVNASGEARNILVISRQGQNLMFSSITQDELVHLTGLPGVAQDVFGDPLISPEIMHMSMVQAGEGVAAKRKPVYVRGVTPLAYEVHAQVQLTSGHLPEEENELLVGRTAHVKLGVPAEELAPGRELLFENEAWIIAGQFEAGGALIESEIWMDNNALKRVLRRQTDTFAVIRMSDESATERALPKFHETGVIERFFKGWSESAYYRDFGSVLAWVLWLSLVMVITITVAGALIGANTMYTAVMNRMREVATYRVLGFSKGDILVSFLVESVALSLAGGALGILAGLAINGLPLSMSYGAFFLVVDRVVLISGVALSLFIGLIGGLFPALKGLSLTTIEGLRHR